jgi:hypothetical protein
VKIHFFTCNYLNTSVIFFQHLKRRTSRETNSEKVVLTTFNLTSRIEGGITEIIEHNGQFIIVDKVYPLIKQNDINLPFELSVNRGTNPTYLLEEEFSKITENLESFGFIKENETNYINDLYNNNYTNPDLSGLVRSK